MYLTIRSGGNMKTAEFTQGENLLNILTREGFDVNAVCGGNGSCGKCKVKIIEPYIEPTARDLSSLSAKELESGIRLACGVTLTQDTEVEILMSGKMDVLETAAAGLKESGITGKIRAVVDIGTTTIVVALIDENASVIGSIGEKNRQAAFGADVIARVKYVANGGLRELHETVTGQISAMLEAVMKEHAVERIEDLTVVGNTAMLHLFFGRDCSGLGFAPYTADFLASQTVNGADLGLKMDIPVRSLPCIASFAGADLTAGIVSVYESADKYTILIDLGTNAEIALFNSGRILASSAAAGPAFEGASIKQGMGATPGAICSYEYSEGNAKVKTIGNAAPAGICGSGLIDIAAELLENEIIDETGYLLSGDTIEVCEGVSLYAADIRELQLAKAAIAAAIDMLLISAEVTAEDIGRVLISGGFGSFINPENAARIGLFPAELKHKTAAIGNSSLAGGILCAAFPQKKALAETIAASTQYLELTNSPEFSERYIEHMMF